MHLKGIMKASVIIPVKNGEKYISECIDSILEQDSMYQIEILVIDDNSSDNTCEILRQYSEKYPTIRVLKNDGRGVAAGINTGLKNSSGEFILRLDSDDQMAENRINSQLDFMMKNPDYAVLGGQLSYIDENGQSLERRNSYPTTYSETINLLADGCWIAHPATCYRRQDALSIGGLNPKFEGAEDYEFWLRLSRIGKIVNLSTEVTKYRIHSGQVTVSKRLKSQIATLRVRIYWIFQIRFEINNFHRSNVGRYGNEHLLKVSRYRMLKSTFREIIYLVKTKIKVLRHG